MAKICLHCIVTLTLNVCQHSTKERSKFQKELVLHWAISSDYTEKNSTVSFLRSAISELINLNSLTFQQFVIIKYWIWYLFLVCLSKFKIHFICFAFRLVFIAFVLCNWLNRNINILQNHI